MRENARDRERERERVREKAQQKIEASGENTNLRILSRLCGCAQEVYRLYEKRPF